MFGIKKEIPVYLIDGMLEAGKTEFLSFTMEQDYFQVDDTTLLIVCEEGVEEYDEKLLKDTNTVMVLIDEESEFLPSKMTEWENQYQPERVLIEYNGMWDRRKLRLPRNWKLEQQVTVIDASTFNVYFNNMRSQMIEQFRNSDMILFNRCDNVEGLVTFKRNLMAVNPQAEIVFEGKDGVLNITTEEDLPYKVDVDHIDLTDEMYPIWYVDAMDNPERYVGKTISFLAMVLKPEQLPKNYFIPGRLVMTCCADDVTYLGYVCKSRAARNLENKQWVKVTAKVAFEYWVDYGGEGIVLYADEVVPAKKPRKEVLGF
ncbi:MAG: GTP-binding protein [Lachnospiraceae bacterium]